MYAKTMLDDTRGRYCSDVFGLYVNLRQISHVRGNVPALVTPKLEETHLLPAHRREVAQAIGIAILYV